MGFPRKIPKYVPRKWEEILDFVLICYKTKFCFGAVSLIILSQRFFELSWLRHNIKPMTGRNISSPHLFYRFKDEKKRETALLASLLAIYLPWFWISVERLISVHCSSSSMFRAASAHRELSHTRSASTIECHKLWLQWKRCGSDTAIKSEQLRRHT